MASVRTRHKSASNLSEFLGTGQEFLVSELPTLHDVLRFGIFLWIIFSDLWMENEADIIDGDDAVPPLLIYAKWEDHTETTDEDNYREEEVVGLHRCSTEKSTSKSNIGCFSQALIDIVET